MKFNLRSLIWLGFFGRIIYAFYIWTFGSRFTGSDQGRFHGLALKISENIPFDYEEVDQWGMFYAYFLSFFYTLTTPTELIGNLCAVLAWLFSAFILLRILNMFSISYRNMLIVVALYILLPSSIINTSAGIRESYQLLFTNLSVYFALIYYYHKDIRALLLLFLSVWAAAVLHVTFILFGVVLVLVTLLFATLESLRIKVFKALPFLLLGSIASLLLFSDYLYSVIGFNPDYEIMKAVLSFQEGSILTGSDARATYKFLVPGEIGNIGSFGYLLYGFFQYLFEPMPWKISSIFDVVLTLENLLRAGMIFLAVKALFVINEEDKKALILFLVGYFVIEFTFSVGTTNWGTAARHHVPSIGLLLLLGITFRDYLQKSESSTIRGIKTLDSG